MGGIVLVGAAVWLIHYLATRNTLKH